MTQQSVELYGRGKIIRFAADSLERPGKPARPAAMLLVGQRGAGKTVLLRRLDAQFGGTAPTAWLDFARDPNASPLTVMLDVKQGLSQRVARVGVIRFPLLQLGFNALSLDPDSDLSPDQQLDLRLRGRENSTSQALRELTQQAGKLLPPEQQAVVTETAALITWLRSGISSRQLHKHLSWYAALLGLGNGTRFGPLLELHDRWQDDDATARRAVWQVLCSALLADLRADFSDFSWRHGQRTTNCLLLLDNADTGAGPDFLESLTECRRIASAMPDPLVVVAAQCIRPGPDLAAGPPILATDDRLRHDEWARSTLTQEHPSAWCPVQLTDLSADHVRAMVKSTVLGKARRDADFVHALTGGHPAAARELTSRLGLAPAGFDPRFVLGARPADQVSRAGEESPTVEGDILALLRPDWVTDSDLDAMAVCGATPELRRAACSSVFRYLDWRDIDVRNLRDMLLGLGWVTGTAEDGLAIRPLPRLLLTRRLARNADLWRDAHHGYLAYYGGVHDMTAVHYHNLALTTLAEPGNLGAVAGYLDKNLPPQRPAAEWNEAVKAITAAPNRLAVVGDQRDAVKWLAGPRESGDRLRAVTRLVAARWLVHDRLLDPARRLARLVADEYYELARLAEGDTEAFYEESDYFRRIAGEWEDRP